jgi:hypothetical protein
MRLPIGWALVALAAGVSTVRAAPPAPSSKPPTVTAGPYQIAVDRISQNRSLVVTYRVPGRPPADPPVNPSCTLQLQMAVTTRDPAAAAGLAVFEVHGMAVQVGNRTLDVAAYGGILESVNDSAVVRAYLYVPQFPPLASAIRSLEGEIVAFEKSETLDFPIPVGDGRTPASVEKGGVRATVQELVVEGSSARATVVLQAPPTSVLITPPGRGQFGVYLYDGKGRSASLGMVNAVTPRPNVLEYRVSFSNLQEAPGRIDVRVLHRGGNRRVFPFRFENVALPSAYPPPAS